MHVSGVGRGVPIGDLGYFAAGDLRKLVLSAVLGHGLEESVDHRVGVSLSALDPEAAVEEAGVKEHLPDDGVTPIVWLHLGIDGDPEVVVAGLQDLRNCHHLIQRDADEVGSELLEGCFEGGLVVLSLSHSVADHTIAVSNEEEHSSGVNSVQSCHVGNRVRVDEDESELAGIEDVVFTGSEVALGP